MKLANNTDLTPVGDITAQMLEPRPLPQGVTEFHEWADRIISGALIKQEKGTTDKSLKFGLAQMILHLGPTESHKPDAYFIHSLRKAAANQVADFVAKQIKAEWAEELSGASSI